MIKIKGLHKFFNKGRQNEIHVINDISLDLPERGMVAIFGKSGCGKTTLLNVIGGLDRFAEGSLKIGEKDIRNDTDTVRNQYIGYIFQNYNLNKDESCFDNIADALRLCGMTDEDEIYERVMAALANVDMSQYAKRTPDTLSGGQQQRIAIARAIVKNPRIILADEPTGNLDEANTVMIMDLLRAIAKEHLVVLVTHEANLVDHYCDTVIELSDGRVVDIKNNSHAEGFAARDKNDIYLGELVRREISADGAEIEYYGESLETPIKIKIVNSGGKLYLKLDSDRVNVLDDSSEIKLLEGVYEGDAENNSVSRSLDMTKLPPFEGTKFGHLFSFKSSVKSGYVSNYRQGKKSRKLLRRCLALFASVIVIMSATFGTAIKQIIAAKNSYNHNVFYVYTSNAETSEKIKSAVGSAESGIDYIRLGELYTQGDSSVYFNTGSFESFNRYDYSSDYFTNAVYLDVSLAKDLELVAGKNEGLENHEMLISTKVADALLEKSTLGYISTREDLVGLISTALMVDGRSTRIAGVVESDESAVYLTELAMAKYVRSQTSLSLTSLASEYKMKVGDGETILAILSERQNISYPKVGESVMIQGKEFKVASILRYYESYAKWLTGNGVKKLDENKYFEQLVASENPEMVKESAEFSSAVAKAQKARYYEYFDYYYAELGEFLGNYLMFEPYAIDAWLYVSKGVEIAKFAFATEEYYKACEYKKAYGKYPTADELSAAYESLPDFDVEMKQYYLTSYEDEMYRDAGYYITYNSYMLSENDYIALSKQMGETHISASAAVYDYYGADTGVGVENLSKTVAVDTIGGEACYTVIHSNDPKATEKWIESNFGDLEAPNEYTAAIITPDDAFETQIFYNKVQILSGLISMAVLLVIMSICMYFIMRSSLMIRIKEVGIYRAIGVSKKNLVFRFLIEAAVLATLTVFVGYLGTSAFIYVVLGASTAVSQVFFYPVWLALVILLILYGLSLFFGILPIMLLLRKTPSEILAKYDI